MPINAVIFDLDGTLVDTAPDLARTLNLVRQEQGLDEMSFAEIRSAVSHGSKALIMRGFALSEDDAQFEKLRTRLLDLYMDNMCIESRLFPHMADTLNTLEQMGMNWGIVTNKPRRMTEPLLSRLGLSGRRPFGDDITRHVVARSIPDDNDPVHVIGHDDPGD